MFVKDIMNRNSIVCTEDTPLAKVYQMMQETGCDYIAVVESYAHRTPIGKAKRAFIVDENGMFCGTLSNFDIETTQTKQHLEDLASRAISKENHTSRVNRIF